MAIFISHTGLVYIDVAKQRLAEEWREDTPIIA